MTARGRVGVERGSWHWRWYQEWRNNKGHEETERAQVDLCHYMRVLLIFGPWRWFWQGSLAYDVPPYVAMLLAYLVAAIALAFVFFTSVSLHVLAVLGGALALAGVIFGIGAAFRAWYIKDTEKADAFLDRLVAVVERTAIIVFFPIWFPIYWIGRFFKFIGLKIGRVIYRAGEWFFTKRLFSLTIDNELFSVSPGGLLLLLAIPTIIIGNLAWHPIMTLAITGGILFVAALIVSSVFGIRRFRRWLREHPAAELEAKPKKEHETTQLVWSWLVAKKHRVCPLIEPRGEGRV